MKTFKIPDAWINDLDLVGKKVSQEEYYEMLEVLPPERMATNAFLVGEPSDHQGENGNARYAAYMRVDDEHYRYLGLMSTATFDLICE